MATTVPIPEPPGLPFFGNMNEINPANATADFVRLADTYGESIVVLWQQSWGRRLTSTVGEIYRLRLPGRSIVILGSQALVNEVCDEKRFQKTINSALGVRLAGPRGTTRRG